MGTPITINGRELNANDCPWAVPYGVYVVTANPDGSVTVESDEPEDYELRTENEKLRELVWELYCLAYPMTVDYETSCYVEDKYKPCSMCQRIHGKAPCASTSRDMSDELCKRIQAALVAECMRALGIEVDDD